MWWLQEAAVALGYSGAALPLWEEFLLRYLAFQTQLQAVLPAADISQHLAQLGQLYEAQSPVLGDIYTLIAPLSPESLPGELAPAQHVLTEPLTLQTLILNPKS